MVNNNWFVRLNNELDVKMRLICFPYAGGGIATYQPWKTQLPENVELIAMHPPARGMRITEPPIKNMDELVTSLLPEFKALTDKPYILLGHSLGSRVAFEVVKSVAKKQWSMPSLLVASGSRAPHIPMDRPLTQHLSDEDFVNTLRELNGTPKEILDNQALMDIFLPMLRADFTMSENYLADESIVLPCNIKVLGGRQDRDVSEVQLKAWQKFSRSHVPVTLFDGDHFFIENCREKVLLELRITLEKLLFQQAVNSRFRA